MFTSKLVKWLDEADPYAIQRLALAKALFAAPILAFVYWVFRPSYFITFITPMLVVSFYESPLVPSIREKEWLLLFIFLAVLLGSVSFYLIYPFRVTFFYYAMFFLAVLYYLVSTLFSPLKNITMIIIATATIALSDKPPANLQVVYDMSTSALLSMITMLICLRIYPNQSLIIWCRAMEKFIACLENAIQEAVQKQNKNHHIDEVNHLGVMRNCRQLIPKKDLIQVYRMAVYLRNIQFALNNLYFENISEAFWLQVNHHFMQLRNSIRCQKNCPLPQEDLVGETPLQHYVARHLTQVIFRWNRLCNEHKL